MSKIIGLYGKKGVGKDTAAEFFLDNDWAHVKFARPLKDIVSRSFGIPIRYLEQAEYKDKEFPELFYPSNSVLGLLIDQLGKGRYALHKKVKREAIKEVINRGFKTPREILQAVGTDVARNICSETYWIDLAEEVLKSWIARKENVIISDVRFQNEADLIKKLGGEVIEITRKTEKDEDNHISENTTLDISKKVCNNTSIEELNEKLKELLWAKQTEEIK